MATTTMNKPKSTAKVQANRQAKKQTVNVLEFFAETPRIDKEQGIVYGAKLLGRISKNGHRYSDQALRDAAATYEGATVNRNHPPDRNATAERMVQDPFGVIRNPQVKITGDEKTDGVYGDHHYPKSDAWTSAYEERVERFPSTLGFSHNAVVTESVNDGQVTFTSVERVRSVDLVANPATTRGIFESEQGAPYMDDDDPNAVATDPNAAPTDGAAATEEQSTEDKLRAALLASISAILEDDSIPFDEAKKKVVTLMDAHNDATSEESDGDGDGDGDGSSSGESSGDGDGKKDDTASLRDRLSKLEKEIKAKNALESARATLEKEGMRPATWQVKAFSVLESEEERKAFIEDAKAKAPPAANGGATPPPKPRSTSANTLESQRQAAAANGGKAGSLPKTQDDLKVATNRLLVT